jgi:NTE family protein
MADQNPVPTSPESSQPVSGVAPEGASGPKPGIALCLSGGGYRAMIFHLGALWRMNQLGFLKKLSTLQEKIIN